VISSSCEATRGVADVCDKNLCDGACNCRIEVLGESSASVEPRNGPFDHPFERDDFKALGGIGALDDLDGLFSQRSHRAALFVTGIAAVSKNMAQPGIERADRRAHADGAVAILGYRPDEPANRSDVQRYR